MHRVLVFSTRWSFLCIGLNTATKGWLISSQNLSAAEESSVNCAPIGEKVRRWPARCVVQENSGGVKVEELSKRRGIGNLSKVQRLRWARH